MIFFLEMGRSPDSASIDAHNLIYLFHSFKDSKSTFSIHESERVETCINHLKMKNNINLSILKPINMTPPSSLEITDMCNR
jgi:hypothetical protein